MSIIIQEASSFEKVADLAKTIWTEHYKPLIGETQVTYMIERFQTAEVMRNQCENEGYRYFEALSGGALAGYCAVQPEEGGSLFLSKIYVEKSFRGQGIAKEFLRFIREKYQPQSIWLTVNKHNKNSIAAYQKMGFEIKEEIVTDIGGGFFMDDYKMRLVLYCLRL
jgi:ribosomal protein S18 acetylase RimI-like enzyme